jgi:hypothetical protein
MSEGDTFDDIRAHQLAEEYALEQPPHNYSHAYEGFLAGYLKRTEMFDEDIKICGANLIGQIAFQDRVRQLTDRIKYLENVLRTMEEGIETALTSPEEIKKIMKASIKCL